MDEISVISILTQILEQCIHDDMPAAEVIAALGFLVARMPVKWPSLELCEERQSDDETQGPTTIRSALAAIKLLLRVQPKR
jgi:hypothetical protein